MTIPDLSAAALKKALKSIRQGTPVELAGVRITEAQMSQIVAAAPEPDGRPTLPRMDLSGAHIAGDPDLAGIRFSGDAVFTRAVFEASARFAEAQFAGEARFGRIVVAEDARFTGAAFSAAARFDHAEVDGNVSGNVGFAPVFGSANGRR